MDPSTAPPDRLPLATGSVLHFAEAQDLVSRIPAHAQDPQSVFVETRARALLAAIVFAYARVGHLAYSAPLRDLDPQWGADAWRILAELGETEAAEVIAAVQQEPTGTIHRLYHGVNQLLATSGWDQTGP